MEKNKKISELFEFLPKSKRNAKYGQETGIYPFFASSNVVSKFVDKPDFTRNKLIIGDGGTASINYADKDFSCSDHCYILKPKIEKELNCKYVYWYLYTNLHILEAGFKGIGIKNISKTFVQNVEIPMPDINKQNEIVTLLDKVDEIRVKKKQANEKLDEFLKSTFIDMFGDPKSNSMNWPQEIFSKITSSRLGKMLDKKQQTGEHQKKYLANFNVQWFRFDLTNLNEMDFNIADQKEFQLLENDVLMCEGGEIGRCAIWKNDLADCYFQKALHRIRCNTEYLKAEYLVFYMYLMAKQNAFDSIIGSKATIAHLTGEKLKQLRIMLPPIKLQNEFAIIFNKVEAQKQKNEQVIEQMDNLFNSLSQKAFNSSANF